MICLKIVRIVLKKNRLFSNIHYLKHWSLSNFIKKPPKNRKNRRAKPLKPPRKFKILSFRGVFLKNLGFL
ncbi:hypothetical protein [Helicobacter pylori]|uniref:hypothetical protein n=1 Tax=Helicobacter pylori TaxID=210 RepID=UPI00123C37C9|nr:hypothetical protein [Helicobacter pylori]KAA6498151.1 hypothetical protein EPC76_00070 [Helicobacter pylori]KAA6505486.1 hypothetical protein EPC77_00220 [Helicobacter pylori]